MAGALASWLVRYRLIALALSVLSVFTIAIGIKDLQIRSDYKIFFTADDPERRANDLMEAEFTSNQNVLFVLAPASGNIFAPRILQAVIDMTEAAWQLPYSQRVDSLSNYQHTVAEADDLVVEDLVSNPVPTAPAALEALKQIAVNEPTLRHRLISPTGHVSAINVQLALPDGDQTQVNLEVLASARALANYFSAEYPELTIHITGVNPLNTAFTEQSERDMQSLIPIMVVLITLLAGLLLRSLSGSVITLLVIGGSVATAMGAMALLGMAISPVSASAPVIILTLAVADCIHLLSSYSQNLAQGSPREEAMINAITHNLKALCLTSVTTAIGFLSMLSSDSPPFKDLGLVAAIGVIVAFVLALCWLPALAIWLTKDGANRQSRQWPLLDWLCANVIHQPRRWFFGCLIIALSCIAFIPNNTLNDDNFGYFSESLPVRQAADFTEAELNGVNVIEYALSAAAAGGANAPEFLAQVEAFSVWLRSQPMVTHVLSYTDTLKRLNRNLHNDDPEWYRLPATRELAAQYQLLYEMSLPFGANLNDQLNMDRSAVRVGVSLKGAKSREILEFNRKALAWLDQHADALTARSSSPAIMMATIGKKNIESMIIGTVLATLIISFILVCTLGSWRVGLLSIIPNAFPAAITLGIWGLLIQEVNLAVAVVFGVTLGIVVDDTVHFLTKYLKGYQQYGSAPAAVRHAFHHVGPAIVTTSVVLASGFALLCISQFEVNAILGAMVASTIVIAMLFDFTVLPALLLILDRWIHPSRR